MSNDQIQVLRQRQEELTRQLPSADFFTALEIKDELLEISKQLGEFQGTCNMEEGCIFCSG